jgi:uncharacterized membrane protein (DUF4010 family)
MQSGLDLEAARNFATALLLGGLVGIEREQHRLRIGFGTIGVRSFILLAEIGAVAGWLATSLAQPWILPAALLAAVAAVIAGYLAAARANTQAIGLTTEFAAVVVCLLGAMTTTGHRDLAVGLGVVTAAVLAYKQPLHGLVAKLGPDDVTAGVRFLLATFIVLPLLPREAIDPWGAIKPYSLWLLVLLISGLSLVGYVATRWLGPGRGLGITAVTGGMASSTAMTLAFVRQGKSADPATAVTLAGGILLAWGVMFLRVLVTVTIVNAALVPALLPSFGAMMAVSLATAAWCFRRRRDGSAPSDNVPLKNPFSLWSAAKFAALFAAVQLVVALARQYLPGTATYLVAGLAGLTEVDAITLTMAQQSRGGLDAGVAAIAIALASLSNTMVKCGMALAMGSPPLRRAVGIGTAAIVAAGGLMALLVRPA